MRRPTGHFGKKRDGTAANLTLTILIPYLQELLGIRIGQKGYPDEKRAVATITVSNRLVGVH